MDKEVLCILPIKDSGKEDLPGQYYTFYNDFTYRCSHWDTTKTSFWKIEDDFFYYKHDHSDRFLKSDNVPMLVDKLKLELSMLDLLTSSSSPTAETLVLKTIESGFESQDEHQDDID